MSIHLRILLGCLAMLCVASALAVHESRQTERLVALALEDPAPGIGHSFDGPPSEARRSAEYSGAGQAEAVSPDGGGRRSAWLAAATAARSSARRALLMSVVAIVLIGAALDAGIARSMRRAPTASGNDNPMPLPGSFVPQTEQATSQFDFRMAAALRAVAETVASEATAGIDEISRRTQSMAENAVEMRQSAAYTSEASLEAATAAERALRLSQTVAGAAEDFTESIHEITGQVNKSAHVIGRAVTSVVAARARIDALNDQVRQISSVADIIAEIASRTNLLALNATIEAVRAGEAGKGFAVVAGEVKQLADQTAKSTSQIVGYIEAVLSAANASIESVSETEHSIKEIDKISDTIARAIEQQSAANQEIASAIEEIAQAADMMAERITHVSLEAKTSGRRAEEAGDHATGLSAAITELMRSLVAALRTTTGEAA